MSVLKVLAYISGMPFKDFCFKSKKYIYKHIAKKFNWNLSNEEIAEKIKYPYSDVSRLRSEFRKVGFYIPRSKKPLYITKKWAEKFKKAGLGKVTDSSIARKFGVTREYVRIIRKQCGIPYNHNIKFVAVGKANKERFRKIWQGKEKDFRKLIKRGECRTGLKKILHMTDKGVSFLERLTKLKVKRIRNKYVDYINEIDWNDSNVLIGRKLGILPIYVSHYRRRFRKLGFNIPMLRPAYNPRGRYARNM